MAEEKQIENKFKRFLESVGLYRLGTPKQKKKVPQVGFWWKNHEGSMFGTIVGRPDIVIFIKDTYLFVEMKASNGKLSTAQIRIINEINSVGGKAVIFYPKDWDVVTGLVRRLINDKH